jgi:hypothetical protein
MLYKIKVAARLQWVTPIVLVTWKAEFGRITVWGQPRQIVWETLISKITRAKWTGGVAQALECLLSKCKALSSNHSRTHTPPINASIVEYNLNFD